MVNSLSPAPRKMKTAPMSSRLSTLMGELSTITLSDGKSPDISVKQAADGNGTFPTTTA